MAVALVNTAPSLDSVYDEGGTQGIPDDAAARQAQRQLNEKFPGSRGEAAVVVFTNPQDLTRSDRDRVKQVSDWLSSKEAPDGVRNVVSISTVPGPAKDRLISEDGEATTLTFLFDDSLNQEQVRQGVQEVRDRLDNVTGGSSIEANLTGPAGVNRRRGQHFRLGGPEALARRRGAGARAIGRDLPLADPRALAARKPSAGSC